MKKSKILPALVLLCAVAIVLTLPSVKAQETLVWSADVYSSGAPVTSLVLEAGRMYRIVAKEMFFYNDPANLGADAQYYTTDPSNSWIWGNHFPAPGGASFLQINGQNVSWGPFSNGNTGGHTYSIYRMGTGASITFRIVDWVDGDYSNNRCHLPVEIWVTPPSEMGRSPGYWKHQYWAHLDGKGRPQNTWAQLVGWTAEIDAYYGIQPPVFYDYQLPPVASLDVNSDGVFTTGDAYTIFTFNAYQPLRLGLANWYNWAAGFMPYTE